MWQNLYNIHDGLLFPKTFTSEELRVSEVREVREVQAARFLLHKDTSHHYQRDPPGLSVTTNPSSSAKSLVM